MSRTDRVLVTIALVLLLLTVGGLVGYDTLFGYGAGGRNAQTIAEIVRREGDIRVKFRDEFQWKSSRHRQRLAFDDAIFSGRESTVDLKIGKSELRLEANTLIVLRKDKFFNSLNLNYGDLSGKLAKGDHITIETVGGEKFELSGVEASKISVGKKNGKTSIKVLEGNAKLVKDGKVQNLSSRDTVVVPDRTPAKTDPLVFSSPQYSLRYSYSESELVEFIWQYSSKQVVGPDSDFTLEVSNDPTFRQILMRENIRGENKFSGALNFPADAYYRVKDGRGNYSETRRLTLLKPQTPALISPQNFTAFAAEPSQSLPINIEITPLQPDSKAVIQVARDSEFKDLVIGKTLLEAKTTADLPVGKYFARARLEYKQVNLDLTSLQTEWSPVKNFSVHEKIDPIRLSQVRLPKVVIIPNRAYPAHLYSASKQAVQNFIASTSQFNNYFAGLIRPGHELVMQSAQSKELPVRQNQAGFPHGWISPGDVQFGYQLEAGGQVTLAPKTHVMHIEMEAPNLLRSKGAGHLSWSPILFAKHFEGEVRDGSGNISSFRSSQANYKLKVQAGHKYSYRVRALGENARPVSAWSAPLEFTPDIPRPAPEIHVAENAEREPAADDPLAKSAVKIEEKKSLFHRAMFWLWAGSGFNYLNVTQTIKIGSNSAEANYENTKGGSMFLEAGYWSRGPWGAAMSYKRTPGDIRVDNYPINKRAFIWDTTTLEALYALPWGNKLLGLTVDWGLRLGIQRHSFPFLYVPQGTTLLQSQSEMTAASLGFFSETEGRWKLHWTMRYQQPVQSSTSGGNTFEIKPTVAFDGSLGTSYALSKHLKTGLFWYGQMHKYDFTYQSATQNNLGTQSLFYSNVEMRMGVDF